MRYGNACSSMLLVLLTGLPALAQQRSATTPDLRVRQQVVTVAPAAASETFGMPAIESYMATSASGAMWGVLIGGAMGVVFGEFVLGRGLDVEHGPDMVIGGAIGAVAGALIGAVLLGDEDEAAPPSTRPAPDASE